MRYDYEGEITEALNTITLICVTLKEIDLFIEGKMAILLYI